MIAQSALAAISLAEFRDALAQFGSGVVVVAAAGSPGPVGLTATAFTSVSLDPPLVLASIGRHGGAHDALVAAASFGISVLAEWQRGIAEQFARRGDRFAGVALRDDASVPLLVGAVASLECRTYARHVAGDHTLLIGQVERAAAPGGRPLLHHARRFGGFAVPDAPTEVLS